MKPKDPKSIYKKLKIASDLFEMAFKVKFHQLSLKHPNLSRDEIKKMVLDLIEKGTR